MADVSAECKSLGVLAIWGLMLISTMRQLSPHLALRRSNVNGNSGLAANSMLADGMAILPGVCPILKNRAKRRLSAS